MRTMSRSIQAAMSAPDVVQAYAPFLAEVAQLRPAGCEIVDVHTHLGLDDDGRSQSRPELLAELDRAGIARACVFPLHDPARRPSYRVPNDRVLAWAAESGGRLVPFCRVDPADGALAEAERALAAGARGIKLHPQSDNFCFEGAVPEGLFRIAAAARVPLLVHAGSFLPDRTRIAEGLCDLALRHPDTVLILGHAAVSDQAVYAARLAGHPSVLYDSSWFAATDLLALLARVPTERLVFGSDPPYGRPLSALYVALRVAARAGFDAATTRAMLGDTVGRVLRGESLPAASAPRVAPTLTLHASLMRVVLYGTMVLAALFAKDVVTAQRALELARSVCRDPASAAAAAALDRIGAALRAAAELLQSRETAPAALDLVVLSVALAATEPA
jgi:predicted TIM-barrel fold metal-dependent hydrolase